MATPSVPDAKAVIDRKKFFGNEQFSVSQDEILGAGDSGDTFSGTTDTRRYKGYLLEMVDITVVETEKRSGLNSLNIREAYTVYMIETKAKNEEAKTFMDLEKNCSNLWRRYNEFDLLRYFLEVSYPHIVVPPLPEKKAHYTWKNLPTDRFDPDFIDRRRNGLENFLLRVAAHPELHKDKIYHSFLVQEENWKETVQATGFEAKADSRLRSLSAGYRLAKPDKTFEDLKNYANDLHSNITRALKMRTQLVDKVYGIHKIHGNYGRVFSEWSVIEEEMGDGLQRAGHFMDVYSQYVDALLEEDEQFADQMKEYLGFAEALRAVCRKQELLQLNAEKAEADLAAKGSEKERLINDNPYLFSMGGMKRLIGANESEPVKDMKVKQLTHQIQQAELEVQESHRQISVYSKQALTDIERFQQQMVKDMKDIFAFYAFMQIKMCKKGIAVWTSVRDCFDKL